MLIRGVDVPHTVMKGDVACPVPVGLVEVMHVVASTRPTDVLGGLVTEVWPSAEHPNGAQHCEVLHLNPGQAYMYAYHNCILRSGPRPNAHVYL